MNAPIVAGTSREPGSRLPETGSEVPEPLGNTAKRAEREALLTACAEAFCATPLPASVCSDTCATTQGFPNRSGTNLLTVADAEQVLLPAISLSSEAAFRAGFAAAEEALGAHGSEWLVNAIERAWKEYAADNALGGAA